MAHRVALLMAEGTTQDVEGDKGAEVADVAARVDGQSTRVHAHGLAISGDELFFGTSEGVVETHENCLPCGASGWECVGHDR